MLFKSVFGRLKKKWKSRGHTSLQGGLKTHQSVCGTGPPAAQWHWRPSCPSFSVSLQHANKRPKSQWVENNYGGEARWGVGAGVNTSRSQSSASIAHNSQLLKCAAGKWVKTPSWADGGGGVTSDQADGSSFTSVDLPESKSINAHRLPRALCSRRAHFLSISFSLTHTLWLPREPLWEREREVGELI